MKKKEEKKENLRVSVIWSCKFYDPHYEGWNFNSGNYLFTTDTK